MRHAWALLVAAVFAVRAAHAETAQIVPAAWPEGRFEKLIQKSPFAPATPVKPAATPPAFANLYLTSVAALGNRFMVSIASRENANRIFLTTGEPGPDGMTLERVDYSAEVGKSKATVKKGNETATLEFDQMALQTPQPAAIAPGQPQVNPTVSRRTGVAPRTNPAVSRVPGAAQTNVPQAGVAPQIPARTNVAPGAIVPPPGGVAQPGAAAEPRRRVRIINRAPTEE